MKMMALMVLGLGLATANPSPLLPDRTGIVQLFEWTFKEISEECKNFLGPYGYAGLQTSPVNEYAVLENRPWYERYQPVSYKIISRSGNDEQFKEMVKTCNNAGVRVFVDVVFNHMCGDVPNAHGIGGSPADPRNKFYPAVPYNSNNFHSSCSIHSYQNAGEVRNCELVGLHDLDQSQSYVRNKIIDFLNHLVDLGVAGFRIDAAKHMWPQDLQYIYSQIKSLSTDHGFKAGTRPYIYQEVIDLGGEGIKATDYTGFGSVVDFKYSREVSRVFAGFNKFKWLRTYGPSWGILPSDVCLAFIDNHDNQRDGGKDILTYKRSREYKMANAFMLSWPHGTPRIMSSYDFNTRDQGPPHNSDYSISNVIRKPDMSCGGGWICEHRWRQIYNMVAFSNAVKGTPVTNFWDNDNNQIAYCRGNKGFIAFNGEYYDLNMPLQTCLPAGKYCDVISGTKLGNGKCSGKAVTVNERGMARIIMDKNAEDGVLAIHINSRA
uniref:Alpha-amylase n=1 Tax=Lethocerus distinctifemur TaxID=280095 RepID=A0A2K8JL28_9HEMI|nr:venom alpha amylase [Lethocerus distinctifemur]